jgi:coproporphyrinogen III oxidase
LNVDKIPATLLNKLDGSHTMRAKFEKLVRHAQDSICAELEKVDGVGKFRADSWVRKSGGGGISRVMQGGKVFEKAGVNVAVVYGKMPQSALMAATERGADRAKGMKGSSIPACLCIDRVMSSSTEY